MSSGSGTNPDGITANIAKSTDANVANSTDTAADITREYNASKHYEFKGTVFEGPTTFSTPLCFVFRWDIACD